MVTFAEIKSSVRSRRLTMAVTSMRVKVGVRSWHTDIAAGIGSLLVLDHFNNGTLHLPSSQRVCMLDEG